MTSATSHIARWLRRIPVTDPIALKNAPRVQLVFLFFFVYLLLTKGAFTFYELTGRAVRLSTFAYDLFVDLTIALAALASFILLRRGKYRLSIRLFIGVLLGLIFVSYIRVGANALRPTALPLLLLACAGLLIGRRDLWGVYAALIVSLLASMGSDLWSGPGALPLDIVERMISIAGLYSMSAVIFDGAIRSLLEGLEDARARGAELLQLNGALAREMEENRESQRRLLHLQKLEGLNRIAAGVAHDFDNMLSVILGYAMRRDAMAIDGTRELVQGLESIERVTRQAMSSTSRMLSFSRKDEIEPVDFDLNAGVRRVVPFLRQLFDAHISIEVDLSPHALWTRIDPNQFDIMVMNVAANAADAMERQGDVFRIATVRRDDGRAALVLRDAGTGIDPLVVPRIFDAFYTTKPAGRGTGLGLAAVHDIVTAHGGDVSVDSRPGEGTAFTIVLRRLDEVTASPVRNPPA